MSSETLVSRAPQAVAADPAAAALKEAGMVKEWWANPSIVGLMGFSLTTMATGFSHAFGFGVGPTVALALAFGGTAQFVAGLIDLRKGSIFGGSAFVGYGAFWWAVAFMDWFLPMGGIAIDGPSKLAFFVVWTLFTLSFALAVFKVGKALTVLFWLLLLAFVLLDLLVMGLIPAVYVGYEIVLTGLVAWYIATATLVNATNGRKVLPLS